MKRLFLLALCIFSIVAQLSAKKLQHEEYEMFAGPKLGVNYYNLTSLGGNGSIAPVVGGHFTFFVAPQLSIGAELLWTQGGSNKIKPGTITYNGEGIGNYDVKMNFINLNFILKYYLNSNFALFTGLNEENVISPKLSTANVGDVDIKDDVSNVGVSIPLGVSYDINPKWSIALQYNLGLKKYAGDSENAKIFLKSAKNQQVMFSVAYNFQIM